ncbi:MAG TPA: type II toxin-antitoxin system RelE/ParE family toxin [Candidatus Nanoarchaeia archaeon]|nr:type II toxin-antitoxin system RelE/ParE family toxin [Candidatus Nanoarchaeia archaeon]
MVKLRRDKLFEIKFNKIKDNLLRERIKKQIEKIIQNPEVGKPMMYNRKGTRELYVNPFRLSYAYIKSEDRIILLDLYHKKEQ